MYRFVTRLLLLWTVAALSATAFAVNPTFATKTIAVPGIGGRMLTADFDRDGQPDIVTGAKGGVAVFFGDGTGGFQRVTVAMAGGDLQIADVDGDGLPDLIGTDFSNIVVARNNGNRTFKLLPPIAGTTATFGDYNGDGKADMALFVAPRSVGIRVGNGDGTFQDAKVVYTSTAPADNPDFNIENIGAAADYNGDGRVDFVVSEGPLSIPFGGVNISFMINQGGLAFAPAQFSEGEFFDPVTLDANGDGRPDVGFSWSACHTPCAGGDVWSAATGTPTALDRATWDDAKSIPTSPIAADFNGDGVPDVGWSYATWGDFSDPNQTGQSILFHLGPLSAGASNDFRLQIGPNDPNGADMVTADFDGDGAPDIAVASDTTGTLHLLFNRTPGVVKPGFAFSASPASTTIAAGQSATVTAKLTPHGGFTSQVAFSCTGLPAGAACSFAPGAIVPSNGSATTTLTITTTPRTAAALHRGTGPLMFAFTLPMFGFVLAGAQWRKKSVRVLLVALTIALLFALVACGGVGGATNNNPPPPPPPPPGGGGGTTNGTPAGSYTVVVTAQGGGVTQTSNITLNVQ
jgi:hypothetical protein